MDTMIREQRCLCQCRPRCATPRGYWFATRPAASFHRVPILHLPFCHAIAETSTSDADLGNAPYYDDLASEPSTSAAPPDVHHGFYSNRFFKLVSVGAGEATLEIDGVKMHITASKMPSQDAKDKVKLVRVKKNSVVLDVCTGLGYSAIQAARAGAKQVITIEREEGVLEVARQNPNSQELFSSRVIEIRNGNAFDVIKQLPSEHFTCALHDPPRLSHAGELYSQEFYLQLARVLRNGARLFHYTGAPSQNGKGIPSGVKERLLKAGFVDVRWVDSCQGFVATKGY